MISKPSTRSDPQQNMPTQKRNKTPMKGPTDPPNRPTDRSARRKKLMNEGLDTNICALQIASQFAILSLSLALALSLSPLFILSKKKKRRVV